MKTRIIKPIITANATSIKVGMPDGIKAAKVPPRIIAAETTTVPIIPQALSIRSLGLLPSIAR